MRREPIAADIPNSTAPNAAEAVPAIAAKESKAEEAELPTKNIAPVQAMAMGIKKPDKLNPLI